MRTRLVTISFVCLLLLHAAATAASRTAEPPTSAAQASAERSAFVSASAAWLSNRLHLPIAASQILSAPESSSLKGCDIVHIRPAPTGATAISLRCPGQSLPQLLLLNLSGGTEISCKAVRPQSSSLAGGPQQNAGGPQPPAFGDCGEARSAAHHPSILRKSPAALPPLVRAGAALHADWRTPSLHAELPVVALESGSIGAEIRVRVPRSDRVFRAHILTAATVSIIEAGA